MFSNQSSTLADKPVRNIFLSFLTITVISGFGQSARVLETSLVLKFNKKTYRQFLIKLLILFFFQ